MPPQGSTFTRTSGTSDPNDPKSVFKDLDLDIALRLPRDLHDRCAPTAPARACAAAPCSSTPFQA